MGAMLVTSHQHSEPGQRVLSLALQCFPSDGVAVASAFPVFHSDFDPWSPGAPQHVTCMCFRLNTALLLSWGASTSGPSGSTQACRGQITPLQFSHAGCLALTTQVFPCARGPSSLLSFPPSHLPPCLLPVSVCPLCWCGQLA